MIKIVILLLTIMDIAKSLDFRNNIFLEMKCLAKFCQEVLSLLSNQVLTGSFVQCRISS